MRNVIICRHCGARPCGSNARGLCVECWIIPDIRENVPLPLPPPPPKRKACRHCRVGVGNRPRRLCWRCYESPDIRMRYASESKFGAWGDKPRLRGSCASPASPTKAPPGTRERLLALQERAARGESLFHPDDEFRPPLDAELATPPTRRPLKPRIRVVRCCAG